MRILFIHGAGGFVEDQEIVAHLRTHLQAPVEMPQIPDDDMSVEAWATVVRSHLATLSEDDVVIGHSFGATILEWVLAEQTWAPGRALLLASPTGRRRAGTWRSTRTRAGTPDADFAAPLP